MATWITRHVDARLSYTGFRIGLYPTVRDYYAEKLKRRSVVSVGGRGMDGTSEEEEENRTMSESEKFALKLLAGATTGAIGSAVFNPIDIVRIRMQSQPYRAISLGSGGGNDGAFHGATEDILPVHNSSVFNDCSRGRGGERFVERCRRCA